MRIAIMKKQAIGAKPLSNYLLVEVCELYVTYNGQQITCKYCGKPSHVQADSQKCIAEFSLLTNSQDKNASRTCATGESLKHSNVQKRGVTVNSQPIFSKKQKLMSKCSESKLQTGVQKLRESNDAESISSGEHIIFLCMQIRNQFTYSTNFYIKLFAVI